MWLLLLFNVLSVLNTDAQTMEDIARCAYPCSLQDKVFERVVNAKLTHNFSTGNPRLQIYTRQNGNQLDIYCIERAGPFYLEGSELPSGQRQFRCVKDTGIDPKKDIVRVVFMSTWGECYYRPGFSLRITFTPRQSCPADYDETPDICDVCDGSQMTRFAMIRAGMADLNCNMPWYCNVTDNSTQTQCDPCEPSDSHDDGFCCEDKTYGKYYYDYEYDSNETYAQYDRYGKYDTYGRYDTYDKYDTYGKYDTYDKGEKYYTVYDPNTNG